MRNGDPTAICVRDEGFTPTDPAEEEAPWYMIYRTSRDVVSVANALKSSFPHIAFSMSDDCIHITVPPGQATKMNAALRRVFTAAV